MSVKDTILEFVKKDDRKFRNPERLIEILVYSTIYQGKTVS